MDAAKVRCPVPSQVAEPSRAAAGFGRRRGRLGLSVVLVAALGFSAGAGLTGCSHAPPIKPWQRSQLNKRAMSFDDGLESRFKQHVFSAREGAEGGYGYFSGGCGCN